MGWNLLPSTQLQLADRDLGLLSFFWRPLSPWRRARVMNESSLQAELGNIRLSKSAKPARHMLSLFPLSSDIPNAFLCINYLERLFDMHS